jgi:large repetitive protein
MYTPSNPLIDGSHSFTAIATNNSINSPMSAFYTVIVNPMAPATPTINPTNGTIISGTAEAGTTINIFYNGSSIPDASTTTNSGGNWTYTPSYHSLMAP